MLKANWRDKISVCYRSLWFQKQFASRWVVSVMEHFWVFVRYIGTRRTTWTMSCVSCVRVVVRRLRRCCTHSEQDGTRQDITWTLATVCCSSGTSQSGIHDIPPCFVIWLCFSIYAIKQPRQCNIVSSGVGLGLGLASIYLWASAEVLKVALFRWIRLCTFRAPEAA